MGAIGPGICRALVLTFAALSLAACASTGPRYAAVPDSPLKPSPRYSGYRVGQPYEVNGRWYTPGEQPDYDETGTASWYGEQFHNRYTADGEVFDMGQLSAAHKTLPLPSLVEVTNLANGKTLVVRVNDRGPFVDGRIIDLSREAAAQLGFLAQGVTPVRVRYVGRAPDLPGGAVLYEAAADPPPKPAQAKPRVQMAATPPAKSPAVPQATTVAMASADIDGLLSQLASAPPAKPSPVLVQAGVFSTRFNAEIAAGHMSGRTEIVPFEASGHLMYKVLAERN